MSRQRCATDYKGVFYRMVPKVGGKRRGGDDLERMYYAVWTTPEGKVIEAKVGRQSPPDAITQAKANQIRGEYVSGARPSPKAKRAAVREAEAVTDRPNGATHDRPNGATGKGPFWVSDRGWN